MVFCRECGKQLHESASACTNCGAAQKGLSATEKRILPAFLLCFLGGLFGLHRFYVGKIGTGILQIFTAGGIGIWTLIDLIYIICGSFTDKQGHKITKWVD